MIIDESNIDYNLNRKSLITTSKDCSSNLPLMDKLLENSGYSLMHFKYIMLSILVLGIEGIQLPLMSLLIIPLINYYNMNEISTELSSSILFIGISLGSLLLSKLTHSIGRVNTLNASLLFISVIQFCLIFSESFLSFTILRFFIGIFLGIIIPIVINTLVEILPIKNRSLVLTGIWAGVALGTIWLYLIIFVYAFNYQTTYLKQLFALCFLYKAFVTFICYIYFTDSPRNYILMGKYKKAFSILKRIIITSEEDNSMIDNTYLNNNYKSNKMFKRKYSIINKYKLNNCQKNTIIMQTKNMIHINNELDNSINNQEKESNEISTNKIKYTNNKLAKTGLMYLFSNDLASTTFILIVLWLFSSITLYGSSVVYTIVVKKLNSTNNNQDIILLQLLSSLFLLVSILIGSYLSEIKSLGRRFTLLISWALCIIISLFLILFPNKISLLSSLLSLCFGLGSNLIITYTVEVYSTKERDFSIGFFMAITRIGGFISQFLFISAVNSYVILPYYFLIVMYIVMFLATLFLNKETYGKPLDIIPNSKPLINIFIDYLKTKE